MYSIDEVDNVAFVGLDDNVRARARFLEYDVAFAVFALDIAMNELVTLSV